MGEMKANLRWNNELKHRHPARPLGETDMGTDDRENMIENNPRGPGDALVLHHRHVRLISII